VVVEDAELVQRAGAGDRRAFEDLVARHASAARATAHRMGAGDDADDVVQDAFVKAYLRLADYRGESSFRSWILAIVANETRNLHRLRHRREEVGTRAGLAAPRADESDTAVAAALAADERRSLVAAVGGLADADRAVLTYRFLLDRTEAETAALLDWPVGTVKSRTSRALAKLRTRLGLAVAVVVAAVLAVLAIPPARVAVAHTIVGVLRFAGVEVHSGPGSAGAIHSVPLPATRVVSLDEARALARFPVGVPAGLGGPDRVEVADPGPDGAPRVVSLYFRGGGVRVDEYDGRFDLIFTKVADDVTWVPIGNDQAVWLAQPHQLTYVDRTGVTQPVTRRLAGPTLLWQRGMVGYRIEGLATPTEAVEVAQTLTTSGPG
jgi:RNA polymerase sigma factor (sigma-70 family)